MKRNGKHSFLANQFDFSFKIFWRNIRFSRVYSWRCINARACDVCWDEHIGVAIYSQIFNFTIDLFHRLPRDGVRCTSYEKVLWECEKNGAITKHHAIAHSTLTITLSKFNSNSCVSVCVELYENNIGNDWLHTRFRMHCDWFEWIWIGKNRKNNWKSKQKIESQALGEINRWLFVWWPSVAITQMSNSTNKIYRTSKRWICQSEWVWQSVSVSPTIGGYLSHTTAICLSFIVSLWISFSDFFFVWIYLFIYERWV